MLQLSMSASRQVLQRTGKPPLQHMLQGKDQRFEKFSTLEAKTEIWLPVMLFMISILVVWEELFSLWEVNRERLRWKQWKVLPQQVHEVCRMQDSSWWSILHSHGQVPLWERLQCRYQLYKHLPLDILISEEKEEMLWLWQDDRWSLLHWQ